jgi:PAS domain-containing protein
VIDQVPAVLWTTDTELRFTSCLGAGLVSLGLWPNQMVGTSLYEFLETEDDDDQAIALHRAALAGEQASGLISWGGHDLHVRVGSLRDSTGAVIGVVGMGFELLDRTARGTPEAKPSNPAMRALLVDIWRDEEEQGPSSPWP